MFLVSRCEIISTLLYFTKRGSQCKTEICREDRQRQTITDSIKKTSEHANETTTTTIKMKKKHNFVVLDLGLHYKKILKRGTPLSTGKI